MISQEEIIDFFQKVGGNNAVTRQFCSSCYELDKMDRTIPYTTKSIHRSGNRYFRCYGCGTFARTPHPVYPFSCIRCGELFKENRMYSCPLPNQVSVVIGCRTKLGHQVTLKLLRAGSIVIGTSRYPQQTYELFKGYEDSQEWLHRLEIYDKGLDLDNSNLKSLFEEFKRFIENKHESVTNVIFCAAQTIRVREKQRDEVKSSTQETNRYGDAKFVKSEFTNTWCMNIYDICQEEMEELMRINAIAPALFFQTMIPLMKKSKTAPYFITVHAREGNFSISKNDKHIHTNMAKAALHMLTRCLPEAKLMTDNGIPFSIHGCDPGWISVDEYYEKNRPWIVPPIDEVDGAARILYPIFRKLPSTRPTRKHFNSLLF
ncbi:putative oxidoreductase [Histomonas meleagridis]|uniref:putative oxidoreductase n=1 Tax=Histomonas meleagridis TaxID=135588 RepID=UPI00355A9E70|nr:putative oxidoreductase [Histomonas meleagridis]KAH0806506.1 putative oxidoreductase [Histomonas meleagridis]